MICCYSFLHAACTVALETENNPSFYYQSHSQAASAGSSDGSAPLRGAQSAVTFDCLLRALLRQLQPAAGARRQERAAGSRRAPQPEAAAVTLPLVLPGTRFPRRRREEEEREGRGPGEPRCRHRPCPAALRSGGRLCRAEPRPGRLAPSWRPWKGCGGTHHELAVRLPRRGAHRLPPQRRHRRVSAAGQVRPAAGPERSRPGRGCAGRPSASISARRLFRRASRFFPPLS